MSRSFTPRINSTPVAGGIATYSVRVPLFDVKYTAVNGKLVEFLHDASHVSVKTELEARGVSIDDAVVRQFRGVTPQ